MFGALIVALVEDVSHKLPEHEDVGQVVTNERHRDCLCRAEESLVRFADADASEAPALPNLRADILEVLNALHETVGKTYTADIRGHIF